MSSGTMKVLTAGGAASTGSKPKPAPAARATTKFDDEHAVVVTAPKHTTTTTTSSTTGSSELEMEPKETGGDDPMSFAIQKGKKPNSQQQQQQQQQQSSQVAVTTADGDGVHRPLHSPGSIQQQNLEAFAAAAAKKKSSTDLLWLGICFFGIMGSFVIYGLLMEYTTSGGRKLHELSFLFVTSGLYTLTAAAGRYVRDETPTTIPPARFAVLGILSMGSTFCSVRSLRYVIYPIQVLAKSCKPVPVMIMGAFMGKKYPLSKYLNVCLIVLGVALFMGAGDKKKKHGTTTDAEDDADSASQLIGILLLFISLCFDGGTGAYEDKLMSVHSVQPFDLMYNIQLGKTILAGIGLIVLNQMHIFIQMVHEMGFLLVALGLSGALGQVFIFVTIAKFGALTCSIIGLARKVTTLVASIYFYGHSLNSIQFTGLVISVGSMVMNFWTKKGKKKGGGGGHGSGGAPPIAAPAKPEEMQKMLNDEDEDEDHQHQQQQSKYKDNNSGSGDVELAQATRP